MTAIILRIIKALNDNLRITLTANIKVTILKGQHNGIKDRHSFCNFGNLNKLSDYHYFQNSSRVIPRYQTKTCPSITNGGIGVNFDDLKAGEGLELLN